jgi:hypothetical protein
MLLVTASVTASVFSHLPAFHCPENESQSRFLYRQRGSERA